MPGVAASTPSSGEGPGARSGRSRVSVATLRISGIRRNGGTQSRVELNPDVVREYADLMMAGTVFPPVRVWFDGRHHWLSDGFHRLAAADLAGFTEFSAELHRGDLSAAVWDSFGANSRHGLRRSKRDIEAIVERALRHPITEKLSTSQIARHLGVPETTLRRWRKRLTSPDGEVGVRIALRGGRSYQMQTARIGNHTKSCPKLQKSSAEIRQDLIEMKRVGSPSARRVVQLIENWLLGPVGGPELLQALERTVESWRRK